MATKETGVIRTIQEQLANRPNFPTAALELIAVQRTAEVAERLERDLRRLLLDLTVEVVKAPLGGTLGMNHAAVHVSRALQAIEKARALAGPAVAP